MSFEFEQFIHVIEETIKTPESKKIVMFAAASNTGGNGEIASWPARMDQVMCIYATDGLGNRCDFTPNGKSSLG